MADLIRLTRATTVPRILECYDVGKRIPARGTITFFFFKDTPTTEIYTLSLHDALPILPSPLVTAPAAQEVGLLGLHQLLHHQPRDGLDERRDDVRARIGAAVKQPIKFIANQHGRGYPPHGLGLLVVRWRSRHRSPGRSHLQGP